MIVTYPDYYFQFRCIGSSCRDNCCIGWEIDIDQKTAARYRVLEGEFGAALREGVQWGNQPCFRLKEGERCYFLNDKNLCDIQANLGEEWLCEICTQHPRFHEWFGSYQESGLSLCCEAVGKLVFERPHPIAFVQQTTQEPPDEDKPDPVLFQGILRIRKTCFSIVQDRSFPLGDRLCLLVKLGREAQVCLDEGNLPALDKVCDSYHCAGRRQTMEAKREILAEAWRGLLDLLKRQTPLEPSWPSRMERLEEKQEDLLLHATDFERDMAGRMVEYEHLTVYFLYRYLLKAAYDGDVWSRIVFSIVGCLTVGLMGLERWREQGCFSLADQIDLAKDYSKQVEYDLDNVTGLMEAAWREGWAGEQPLSSMISSLFPSKQKEC